MLGFFKKLRAKGGRGSNKKKRGERRRGGNSAEREIISRAFAQRPFDRGGRTRKHNPKKGQDQTDKTGPRNWLAGLNHL